MQKSTKKGKEVKDLIVRPVKKIEGTDQQPSFLDVIERLASNPDVNVEKIQRIMDMQEQILTRQAKQAFNDAMFRAQSKMPIVLKKKNNQATSSKYAGYDEILKLCQPVYTAEGFSVTFYQGHSTAEDPLKEDYDRIMADVMHKDGYTKTVHVDIPVETTGIKGNANMTKVHATGSAFQYGRGYLMRMIFNIPTGDDDDGNGAGGKVVKLIDDKKKSILLDFLDSKKVDKVKFFEYVGAPDIDHIPDALYPKALEARNRPKEPNNKPKRAARPLPWISTL